MGGLDARVSCCHVVCCGCVLCVWRLARKGVVHPLVMQVPRPAACANTAQSIGKQVHSRSVHVERMKDAHVRLLANSPCAVPRASAP